LTRSGWLLLLLGVVLLALGVVKNINLLALLGIVLLVVLLLNILVVGRRLGQLRAHRHFDELLFAGSSCRVDVWLHNSSAGTCPGVRLEDTISRQQRSWYLDRVEGHDRRLCQAEVRLPLRGWHAWGPLAVSSRYPFGLVRRRVILSGPDRVLVLPRPGRLDRERLRHQLRGADPQGERVRRRGWRHEAAQADFHGLRPFRPGDSPRWIHWRTSARRGELMVREFEDVPGDDLVLLLSPEVDLEPAVDAAATIVWEWCRRRGDRLVLALGREIHDGISGPDHARRLLERLATLAPEDLRDPAPEALLELPATLAVVVLSSGPSALAAAVETTLHRPATVLDVNEPQEWGFAP
jgi:uncharacterized protein (DUF58 family)